MNEQLGMELYLLGPERSWRVNVVYFIVWWDSLEDDFFFIFYEAL